MVKLCFKRRRAEGPTAQPEGLRWRLTSNGLHGSTLQEIYFLEVMDSSKWIPRDLKTLANRK